jgi:hypothetical protein
MPIKGGFDALWKEYPWNKFPAPNQGQNLEWLKKEIGGDIATAYLPNLCAIRISYSFNHAGLPLPAEYEVKYQKKPMKVLAGKDKRYYACDMTQFRHYITEKFGKPDHIFDLDKVSGDTIKSTIGKKRGVLMFKAKPGQWSDAYGHATLWDGTKTGTKLLEDGKTEDARVADHSYFPESQTVYFWEVTNVPKVVKPTGFNPNDSLRAIILHDSIGPGGREVH